MEAADLAEAEAAYRLQLGREMYEAGRRDAEAEMAQAWAEAADPVAHGGPAFADLEECRWGPGGREHFADPRPGDYPGLSARPEPEPELEPEAG